VNDLDAALASLGAAGASEPIRKAASAARAALGDLRSATPAMVQAFVAGLESLAGAESSDGKAAGDAAAAAFGNVMATAFPGAEVGPGVLDMFRSKIVTTGGSGIDIVAPGFAADGSPAGTVNAGLPGGAGGGNLGILTQSGGGIRTVLSGDFNVNQSKILTAQSGDIMLYSTDGSIDAGRGALTSKTSSPPRRVPIYKDGEMIGYAFLPPIDVAGSGIRTVTSDPDGPGPALAPAAGSIYLFAPKGTINAGEAGIASAGDVTIRADVVKGAENISAAGSKSGVPPVDAGGLGTLSSASNIGAGNNKQTEDSTRSASAGRTNASEPVRATLVSVEVLGFGDCDRSLSECGKGK
ncbi:MAG: filamentous hemagglutinin family protein, partial [Rhodocyclaceae bacterium]